MSGDAHGVAHAAGRTRYRLALHLGLFERGGVGRRTLVRLGWLSVLGLVGGLVLVPLAQLQLRAMRSGAYASIIEDAQFPAVIRNTVLLAAGSVGLALFIGTWLAWSAFNLPRRLRFLAVLPMVSIMLPPLAQVTGWIFLLSERVGYLNSALRAAPWWSSLERGPFNVHSLPWIVIITGIMLVPFTYIFVLTSLRGMDASTFEAAAVAGAGQLRTFVEIVMPALRPALVYSATISLLLGLGQFTAPLLLGRQPRINVVTTSMFGATTSVPPDYGLAAAYGSPLLVLGLAVVALQRRLVREQDRFQTMATRGHRPRSGGSTAAALPIVVYALIAVVMPIAALALVSVSPFWTGSIDIGSFTLEHFRGMLTDPNMISAIGTTIRSVILSTLLVLPIGFAAASTVLARRGPGRVVRGGVDLIVGLPHAIPGIVFGAGILFAYTQGLLVLYGSQWIFVVAYLTVALPFVTRLLQSGLIGAGRSITEASRVAGAGPVRTQVSVVLPTLRASIAAAVALSVALLLQEFSASVLVRSRSHNTLGPLLYDVWSQGFTSQVAVIALTMCAVATVTVGVALAVGGRGVLESTTRGI